MAIRSFIPGALFLIALTSIAPAQEATPLGEFRNWKAYTHNGTDGKACYIAGQPQNSRYSREISGRDPVFFLVTTRLASNPQNTVRNEPSTIIGFSFQANSTVSVSVDGQSFNMFTSDDNAWFNDRATEPTFVNAMRGGTTMTVESTSSRGTVVTDTYSLAGVTAALNAVAQACP